jgi:hypothetical protein
MSVLSGMVTSATKAALLVQFGSLVGTGVSGVGGTLTCADGVFVAAGIWVAAVTSVFAGVDGVKVSTGDCAPQAESVIARQTKLTSNIFLIKTSFSFLNSGGRQFHYIHKMIKKTFVKKT